MVETIAQTAAAPQWKELVPYLGVPGVMLLSALLVIHKGWFKTKRECDGMDAMWKARYDDMVKAKDDEIASKEEQIKNIRADKDDQIKVWKELAIPILHVAERATNAASSATEALAKNDQQSGGSR